MKFTFKHTLHRDQDIELSVTAYIYLDEIDYLTHEPDVEISDDEAEGIFQAASDELDKIAKDIAEEDAYHGGIK